MILTQRPKPSGGRSRQMRNVLKKIQGSGPRHLEGLTMIELLAVVGAMVAFASIYTYIVIGAIKSNS